jgi:hypothetical protein
MSKCRPSTNEAENLIKEAQKVLRKGEVEAALWRLVDAAGLLKEKCFINPCCMGTKYLPTGRGYYIGEKE